MKLRHLPLRATTGVFILDSGIKKSKSPHEMADDVHGFATAAYPELKRIRPEQFVRLLAAGEIATGAALLLPFVPTVVAGAALTAFSAGLVGLYVRAPGMHEEGSLEPTKKGMGVAKDVWMLGIGLALLIDGLTDS
ncbi:MAG: hypothetical protein ACRDZ3_03615 [Acidimicrobiia bacterium]